MSEERFSGTPPLTVGVLPGQHPEVLRTAADLSEKLAVPLLCAYVDEASYLVEWDPSRSAHRLSLHPDADDAEIRELSEQLRTEVSAAFEGREITWTFRMLAGDPARALGKVAADAHASMIIVGTTERGLVHRISQALNGSVATWLSHHQDLPVLVVPPRRGSHRELPE
jgi:nucleotide-binding universal stress UspA family protein